MACLINSIDDFGKKFEIDPPETEEELLEFAQKYEVVVNGNTLEFDHYGVKSLDVSDPEYGFTLLYGKEDEDWIGIIVGKGVK